MHTQPPAAGYRALRRGRTSVPGQSYLVTTVTAGRTRLFDDWRRARAACFVLCQARCWRASHLQCWVLMPDHLHLMLEVGKGDSLSRLVQRVKSVTSRAMNRAAGSEGRPVWAPGFHDRALRSDEDRMAVARYVLRNPLRAGLVERVGDYPYWNAVWLGVDGTLI